MKDNNMKKYLMLIPMVVSFDFCNAMDGAYAGAGIGNSSNMSHGIVINPKNQREFDNQLLHASHDIAIHPKNQRELNNQLLHAIANNKFEMATILIERGADINCANQYGNTPLIEAARLGNLEMAQILTEKGVNINCANQHGNTPLMEAARCGNLEMVKILLMNRADKSLKNNPTSKHPEGQTAMDMTKNGSIKRLIRS